MQKGSFKDSGTCKKAMALYSGKPKSLGFLKPLAIPWAKYRSRSLADVNWQGYPAYLSLIWPIMISMHFFYM